MTQVGKTCRSLAAISVCDRQCKGGTTALNCGGDWKALGAPASVISIGCRGHIPPGNTGGKFGDLLFLLMPLQLWVWSPGLWATGHHQVCGCCKEGAVAQGVIRSLSAHLFLFTSENRNYDSCSWLLSAVEKIAVLHWRWRGPGEENQKAPWGATASTRTVLTYSIFQPQYCMGFFLNEVIVMWTIK